MTSQLFKFIVYMALVVFEVGSMSKVKYPERILKYPERILSFPGLLLVCLPGTISESDYFVYSDNGPFADAKHPPG